MGTWRRDSWTAEVDGGSRRRAKEMRAVPLRRLTVAAAMTLMRWAPDVRLAECPVVRHLTGDMLSERPPARPDPARRRCRLLYGSVNRFQ